MNEKSYFIKLNNKYNKKGDIESLLLIHTEYNIINQINIT